LVCPSQVQQPSLEVRSTFDQYRSASVRSTTNRPASRLLVPCDR
jgi:hypothetical protein